MKNDQDSPDKPSRRVFSKSFAAALMLTPLAFTPGCKEKPPANLCRPLGSPEEPHEPPIIIGGGSLTMECEQPMTRETKTTTIPDRMYLYRYGNYNQYHYGKMLRLEVITEHELLFTYDCHPLANLSSPTLKIWLQRYMGGWVMEDIDLGRPSHLYIRYQPAQVQGQTYEEAVLEADKEFGQPEQGFKLVATYKHAHAGYAQNPPFRIGRWQLLDGATVVHEAVVGPRPIYGQKHEDQVLGFQLVPRFNHLGEDLRRRGLI